MVGPETLLPPCPRKAEVPPARPRVVAPVNPQGLCHLHSTEPTLSPGFLGCRSPEIRIRAPGTALKVPLHLRACSRTSSTLSASAAAIGHLQTVMFHRLAVWHCLASSKGDFLSWKWPCCRMHLTRIKKSLRFHKPVRPDTG